MPETIDGQRSPYSMVCLPCKNYNRDVKNPYRCKAFDEIPEKIWEGDDGHIEPYKGDNGIQFEPIKS